MTTESIINAWQNYLLVRPKVSLSACMPGQRCLTNHGNICIYMGRVERDSDARFDLEYNGVVISRTTEGYVSCLNPLPGDEDIVYVFPLGDKQRVELKKKNKRARANKS